jgi:hypothetical protein
MTNTSTQPPSHADPLKPVREDRRQVLVRGGADTGVLIGADEPNPAEDGLP